MGPETAVQHTESKQILTDQVRAYIRMHYTEKYSLNEMASALFVNKYYLARTFREVTGMTPLQYHNQLRCEKAAALLADPHLSITGIALRTGFTSVSHFTRIFKQYKGCTPSDYRKTHTKKSLTK